MFSNKNFVISIGNSGTIVALHTKKTIISKVFIEELNDESKKELEKIFRPNSKVPVYILVDTVDQNYKKKIYPSISKTDISRIAKRDMATDGDSQSIKNFCILTANKKKKEKNQLQSVKWNTETGAKLECLFISASSADFISKWIDYCLDLSNRVVGIYMLPAEAFSFFKQIKNSIDNRSKIKNKKNDLYILIIQNKVCGTRQIVFNDQGILFTRVVNYTFDKPDFIEKFEQDIYSTFEYLKRLYRDVSLNEIDIVNILPENVLEILKTSSNIELNYINFTPNQACREITNEKLIAPNSNSCDLIISNIFVNSKKFLKFNNEKIKKLEDLFMITISIYYSNIVFIFLIIITLFGNLYVHQSSEKVIEQKENERSSASEELSRIRKNFQMETQENIDNVADTPDRIDDLGKMQEIFANITNRHADFYVQLKFIKNYNLIITRFNVTGGSINNKMPTQIPTYQISFSGNLINETGDIDELFGLFDDLNSAVKKEYEGQEVKGKEMSKDMDFTQKYYEYPVNFEIARNLP